MQSLRSLLTEVMPSAETKRLEKLITPEFITRTLSALKLITATVEEYELFCHFFFCLLLIQTWATGLRNAKIGCLKKHYRRLKYVRNGGLKSSSITDELVFMTIPILPRYFFVLFWFIMHTLRTFMICLITISAENSTNIERAILQICRFSVLRPKTEITQSICPMFPNRIGQRGSSSSPWWGSNCQIWNGLCY